jgi:ADP-ribosylation factor GTPase-activating protein 1
MDAWSADQLKKMQAGGNGKLNEFFKQYGVDKYTDIRDKYHSKVAEVSTRRRAGRRAGAPLTVAVAPAPTRPPNHHQPAPGGGMRDQGQGRAVQAGGTGKGWCSSGGLQLGLGKMVFKWLAPECLLPPLPTHPPHLHPHPRADLS